MQIILYRKTAVLHQAFTTMDYKLENSSIGMSETDKTDVDLICEMETAKHVKGFILPYESGRHKQVIDNADEEHLTVWEKRTGSIIGFIILAGLDNPHLSLELRRIVIQKKGQGFGRQCVQLLKEYCFKKMKFHRLWLDVFEDNTLAIHLYTTEGFQVDGRLREMIKEGDCYRSLLLLSVLETEYIESR